MQMQLFNIFNHVLTFMSKANLLGGPLEDWYKTLTAAEKESVPSWMINIIDPLLGILDALLVPVLIIVGTVGSIYAIVLAVNFSRAETADKREEAKKRMINAIIGLVVMVLILVVLQLFVSYAPDIVTWITGTTFENRNP